MPDVIAWNRIVLRAAPLPSIEIKAAAAVFSELGRAAATECSPRRKPWVEGCNE
jgi:hypothetical protein